MTASQGWTDAIDPLADVVAGQRFGPAELVAFLAQGSMGVVWLARIGAAPCVVKLIAPALVETEKGRAMFVDEIRVTGALRHPNAVALLTAGTDGPIPYAVFELAEGGTLLSLCRWWKKRHGEQLPFEVAIPIVVDACRGLHAAHELRGEGGLSLDVVHRDISPDNILLARDGRGQIADFGVAKGRERLVVTATAGVPKGKWAFMAPEQRTGRPIDRRADIWSMGAVLYWIATGDVPPEQGVGAGLAVLPLPIRALIARAMAEDPNQRHRSALELAEHVASTSSGPRPSLEEYFHAQRAELEAKLVPPSRLSVRTIPPPSTRRRSVRAKPKRSPFGRYVVAIILGLLIALGWFAWYRWFPR